jgi:hypothetical protein
MDPVTRPDRLAGEADDLTEFEDRISGRNLACGDLVAERDALACRQPGRDRDARLYPFGSTLSSRCSLSVRAVFRSSMFKSIRVRKWPTIANGGPQGTCNATTLPRGLRAAGCQFSFDRPKPGSKAKEMRSV